MGLGLSQKCAQSPLCEHSYCLLCFAALASPKGPKIEKFKIALRDWNFQARLHISSEPPTKPYFLWGKFQAEIEIFNSGARGPPQFLKKRSENAGANENLSGGFAAIPGIAPRVAPRIVGFVLIKSWEAIPRMEFRIPRMEFPIPRAVPRIPRNSPRAPRMPLFTPRAFFLKLGWSPGFWSIDIEVFKRDWHFKRDWIFSIFGPLGSGNVPQLGLTGDFARIRRWVVSSSVIQTERCRLSENFLESPLSRKGDVSCLLYPLTQNDYLRKLFEIIIFKHYEFHA